MLAHTHHPFRVGLLALGEPGLQLSRCGGGLAPRRLPQVLVQHRDSLAVEAQNEKVV